MLNRRDFLKGAAAAAAAGAALPALPATDRSPRRPLLRGPGPVRVRLRVNGEHHTLEVEPRVTLLDALRDRLHITGPKKVCDRGACGACTVLRNGEPILSCLTLAVEHEGAELLTVEGIGRADALHPVQAAFVAHDALQCGFCTPGMVLAVYACLRRNPHADREEIRRAVAGNLCRCGTYPKVFAAALAARRKGG